MDLPPRVFESLVRLALEEDLGEGDVTSEGVVEAEAGAEGTIVAREEGVLAEAPVAARVFEVLDPAVEVKERAPDGRRLEPGSPILVFRGRARALLSGERTALNFLGLEIPFLGFVPEDPAVAESIGRRRPVPVSHPDAPAAVALSRLAEEVESHLDDLARSEATYAQRLTDCIAQGWGAGKNRV